MAEVVRSSLGNSLNPQISKHLQLPPCPTRFRAFLFDINPQRSTGSLGKMMRQMGFFAFVLASLARLRTDYRTYGFSAAFEAVNRAPKEALSRGAKHLVVNYIVPNIQYAAALVLFAGFFGAIRVGLTYLNPWFDAGAAEFQKVQEDLNAELSKLQQLIQGAEGADPNFDATKDATWNDLLKVLGNEDLGMTVTSRSASRAPSMPASPRKREPLTTSALEEGANRTNAHVGLNGSFPEAEETKALLTPPEEEEDILDASSTSSPTAEGAILEEDARLPNAHESLNASLPDAGRAETSPTPMEEEGTHHQDGTLTPPTLSEYEHDQAMLIGVNFYADSIIKGIFDCIAKMCQIARKPCPFEDLDAFKSSNAAEVIRALVSGEELEG